MVSQTAHHVNPGPAGAGILLQDPKGTAIHLSRHLGTATNNVAELRAVWVACDELYETILARRMEALPVFNQYTIRATDGVTRVKANKKLVHSVQQAVQRLRNMVAVTLLWVPGHAEIPGNERRFQL